MQYYCRYASPLGELLIIAENHAITTISFQGQKYIGSITSNDRESSSYPAITEAIRWLDSYFTGNIPDSLPPLAPQGSDFRRRVWDILLDIPYGKIRSYGSIAKDISPKMSAQAIGNAVGHNPIAIIIPCHRVLGADNSLTGYDGGIHLKAALLDIEGIEYKE